ncbi:MAG: GspH/FimT family pseudopilin [Cycloclasticus sp.]
MYKRNGFTLLEILLVLTISSVLLVFVAPDMYRTISGMTLPKATQELATALRRSSSQAVNASTPASLLLNVKERSYQLSGSEKVYQLPKDLDVTILTGAGLVRGASSGAIFFYPDGSSSGGRISLQQGEREQQIHINWLTGEVDIDSEV